MPTNGERIVTNIHHLSFSVGWFEHMKNLIIQVSRCLGIWDLGFGVKIIGFPTSWQDVVSKALKMYLESFNVMPYILAYFLHPDYRGNGLKNIWTKISEYVQKLWENMGYNIDDQEILITQMLNFKAKQGTYSTMSCEDQPPFLRDLALKVFAVTLHNASCKRMFSVLG
ncbi:hypothetical protein C1646_662445 [Rhizophagus diaphanus]|nr:hypothetical protein C1646_662445 [Rhizophagus diaphanus] [Rhizophagus sp. MUCL 43196]